MSVSTAAQEIREKRHFATSSEGAELLGVAREIEIDLFTGKITYLTDRSGMVRIYGSIVDMLKLFDSSLPIFIEETEFYNIYNAVNYYLEEIHAIRLGFNQNEHIFNDLTNLLLDRFQYSIGTGNKEFIASTMTKELNEKTIPNTEMAEYRRSVSKVLPEDIRIKYWYHANEDKKLTLDGVRADLDATRRLLDMYEDIGYGV